MPSDDKRDLRLPDLTRREFGKRTVEGLAGLATDLITGPITGEAISSITESSSVIPMTKNLVIEYYKLEDELYKIFKLDKYSSKWRRLDWDEKKEIEERRNENYRFINDLKEAIRKREEWKKYLKSSEDPLRVKQHIEDLDSEIQSLLNELESKEDSNKIKKFLAQLKLVI